MHSVVTHVANLETRVDETPSKGGRLGDVSVRLRSVTGSITVDMPRDVARELYVCIGSQLDKLAKR